MYENLERRVAADLKTLGRRLKDERLHYRLTQASLAQAADVDETTIRALERDGNSTLDTFLRVAHVLSMRDRLLHDLFLERRTDLPQRVRRPSKPRMRPR